MVEKCTHCKKDFVIDNLKKYYSYKLRRFKRSGYHYFCSYACMKAAKKNNPERYIREK